MERGKRIYNVGNAWELRESRYIRRIIKNAGATDGERFGKNPCIPRELIDVFL